VVEELAAHLSAYPSEGPLFADEIGKLSQEFERLQIQRRDVIRRLRIDEASTSRGSLWSGPREPSDIDEDLRVIRAQAATRLAEFDRRLLKIMSEQAEVRERLARDFARVHDRLRQVEADAFVSRRPPLPSAVSLTEGDLRSAQNSVPGWVVILLGLAAVAVFAISQAEVPEVFAAVLAVATFLGTMTLGGLSGVLRAACREA